MVRHNFFLSSPFLLFDRAAGFPSPRPRDADAVERRSRQGWPLFAATARLGLDADRARRHTCGVGANALATSQFRFPLSLQNRGKCFREAHQLGRFRDHYSGVSNIGYIWRLEERSYEAWIAL